MSLEAYLIGIVIVGVPLGLLLSSMVLSWMYERGEEKSPFARVGIGIFCIAVSIALVCWLWPSHLFLSHKEEEGVSPPGHVDLADLDEWEKKWILEPELPETSKFWGVRPLDDKEWAEWEKWYKGAIKPAHEIWKEWEEMKKATDAM